MNFSKISSFSAILFIKTSRAAQVLLKFMFHGFNCKKPCDLYKLNYLIRWYRKIRWLTLNNVMLVATSHVWGNGQTIVVQKSTLIPSYLDCT